ncbi:MAG: tetratricopeptide repeat protein [Rubrivivax sp.]|nr:tetratricopeptide repeat protein [Rubrivivax sp.]
MTWTRRRSMAALGAALAPGWPAAPTRAAASRAPAPLFDGMGDHNVADATASGLARRFVAQGMVLAWGFNPAEAARSFEGAIRLAPGCAACHWGLAWALGPTINADMAPADAQRVAVALEQARALAHGASARFRDLIAALSLRHPGPRAEDIDEDAYAERMRVLAARHSRDADIAVLAAESLLNLHPYDWWQPDGRALPWTGEIVALLARALQLAPGHPGANHYWVHLFELSATPERAVPQADRLRTLVPGSGHLLHMPAHIDMRTGRYAEATAANQRSIDADLRYLAQVDAQGAYRVGYVAHNHHFLWASAAMQGRSELAIAATQAAWPAACGPRPGDLRSGVLQHYAVLPLHALLRFGRWQEILTRTRPPDGDAAYLLAMWHYARGTAWLRTGRVPEARAALAQLQAVAAEPELQATKVKNVNPVADLVRIARLTLQADLEALDGRRAAAVELLQQAVATEDALAHDEPHLWLAPTRHALGAALLDAGRAAQAERVYRQDLRHYPDNGWSLVGLALALQAQGKGAEARAAGARFRRAWRDADVALTRSRF